MDNIIQKIKVLFSRKNPPSYGGQGIRPQHDWQVMVSIMFVVLCIAGGLGWYLYTQIQNGTIFVVKETSPKKPVVIQDKLLKKVVDDITSRESIRASLATSTSFVSDPAL